MLRKNFLTSLAMLTMGMVSVHADAVQRAYVASFGLDSNVSFSCDVNRPCRFFQAATTVVDNNGEVVALDSAAYGAVTLTRSISLTGPTGAYTGIAVFPGANGVTVATAGINVILRGLTINGQGGGNGVEMTAGSRLTIENCTIANMNGSGIFVDTNAFVRVTDTTIRDNGGSGITLSAGSTATITRAMISGNAGPGVFVYGIAAGTTTIANLADTTLDGNSYGLYVSSGGATAVAKGSVYGSRIVRNTIIGLYNVGPAATLDSAGNNSLRDNVLDRSGTITVTGMQ